MSDFGIGKLNNTPIEKKENPSGNQLPKDLFGEVIDLEYAKKAISEFLNSRQNNPTINDLKLELSKAIEEKDWVKFEEIFTQLKQSSGGFNLRSEFDVIGGIDNNYINPENLIPFGYRETIYKTAEVYKEGSGTSVIEFLDESSLSLEEINLGDIKPETIDLNGKPSEKEDYKFYYINGILTEKDEAEETALTLSQIMNLNIESIYNPTEGLSDIKQAIVDYLDLGVIKKVYNKENGKINSETVNQEIKNKIIEKYNLNDYVKSNGDISDIDVKIALDFVDLLKSGKSLKIIAHSHGASVTANSLVLAKKFLEDEQIFGKNAKQEAKLLLEKVSGIIIGPAANKGDFPEGVHLIKVTNPDDPINKLTPNIKGAEKIYNLPEKNYSLAFPLLALQKTMSSIENIGKIVGDVMKESISTGFNSNPVSNMAQLAITVSSYSENALDAHSIDMNYLKQDKIQRLLREFAKSELPEIQNNYELKSKVSEEFSRQSLFSF